MRSGLVRPAWLLAAVGCALLAGCPRGGGGPPAFKTKGRVVENGQPVAFQNYREGYMCLQVDFYLVDDAGKLKNAPHAPAFVAQDGSFTLAGEKGTGIPAGKYRVAVRHVDRTKAIKPDPAGNIDAWQGKFDENKSPFVFDVTGSQGDIVIDLAKAPAPSK